MAALGRTLVPPLDPRDAPEGFASAIAELDELGARMEHEIAEARKQRNTP